MKRTYTADEIRRRHPCAYYALLAIAGAGYSWSAWLGRSRRRQTPNFGSADTAHRALLRGIEQ